MSAVSKLNLRRYTIYDVVFIHKNTEREPNNLKMHPMEWAVNGRSFGTNPIRK